jgi:CheY-like chemotaxis protein
MGAEKREFEETKMRCRQSNALKSILEARRKCLCSAAFANKCHVFHHLGPCLDAGWTKNGRRGNQDAARIRSGWTVRTVSDDLFYRFRLPMDEPTRQDGKSSEKMAHRSHAPSEPTGRIKVVVVEDDAASRELIKLLLELERAEVIVAADGRAGLDAILCHRPHVALVDIGLPEIDGFEVARRVREALARHEVWLVAVTGYGERDDHQAVAEAGFDEHLVKPVPIDEIYRILHDARRARGVGAAAT